MAELSQTLHRAQVEYLVRKSVYERLGRPLPQFAQGPNPLLVNVSARHCHLTPEAVEILFGKGRTLTPMKAVSPSGHTSEASSPAFS